ncbi:MAG TPA: 2Fe-2S iron-sulfur cluster-binding protein, partial [Solirubrobacteraceae bacterium]
MRVRFEPLGEEIECGSQETVLDAAFRQGYSLAHGCREGQCSACKCFLLEGEVELRRYSDFALSDTERAGGYALMCRALPESDLVVELLHFDPDNYRLENAIRDGVGKVDEIRELTHDIVGLRLSVGDDLDWLPGQYLDLHVPGPEGERRSFSIANLPGERAVELMIKRYPGGRFSGLLGEHIKPGTELGYTGPYGAFHLRRSEAPILMVAGGSGMAPVLAVLRQLASEGCSRPVRFFFGAREERDLFALDEIVALGERLEDFRFVPVTGRFVHEAIDEELEAPDVYMCGPPPMLDAVQELLVGRGVDPARIFADRFTTSAQASDPEGVSAPDTAPASERDFAWFTPAARRATLYEDVTIDTQPSVHRHLTRGWPLHFADGRGTWNDASTALRSSDWFAFRDPGQQWERTYYQAGTAFEHQIEGALRSAAEQGLLSDLDPVWVEFLRAQLQVSAYLEHGLWFALATAARDCLSDTVA